MKESRDFDGRETRQNGRCEDGGRREGEVIGWRGEALPRRGSRCLCLDKGRGPPYKIWFWLGNVCKRIVSLQFFAFFSHELFPYGAFLGQSMMVAMAIKAFKEILVAIRFCVGGRRAFDTFWG